MNIVPDYYYFVFHPTLRCNLACSYCIQLHDYSVNDIEDGNKDEFYKAANEELDPKFAALQFNKHFKSKELHVHGGEVFIWKDCIEFFNGLENFDKVVIGTNLATTPKWLRGFLSNLRKDKQFIIAPSFHISQISAEKFSENFKICQESGLPIEYNSANILMDGEWQKAKEEMTKRGISVRLQEFQGFRNGKVYPEEFEAHGGRMYKLPVMCRTTLLVVGPTGLVSSCSHLAYTFNKELSWGSIQDDNLKINFDKATYCNEWGYCQSCNIGRIFIEEILGND